MAESKQAAFAEEEFTEDDFKKIESLMIRKRPDVIMALARLGSASQKELAKASGTTPTSLSNILLKFEDFPYQLLEREDQGRNRIYRLTGTGQAYVRRKLRGSPEQGKGQVVSHEELRLQQALRDSIKQMQERNEEWKVVFDRILLNRIYGIEEEYGELDEALVNVYVASLQKALMSEFFDVADLAGRLLGDEILISRLEKFLAVFYAFMPFLQKLEKKEDFFDIYEIFRRIIRYGEDGECQRLLQKLELSREGHTLADVMQSLKAGLSEKDRKTVYNRLEGFMPGMEAINAYLASWLVSEE